VTGPQEDLARVWERLLPPDAGLAAVDWRTLVPSDVVPVAHHTAQPRPRGYTREEVVWRT